MKSLVRSLMFASVAFAALVAPVRAADGDILVERVRGDVAVIMAGKPAKVAAGMVLLPPASVSTGSDGSIDLRQGPTTLSVGANTTLEFPALEKPGAAVDRIVQPRGNVFYDVGKRNGRRLRVESPHLVGVIKGTQFNVAAEADRTTISLFEGRLEVRASDDSVVIDLEAGQVATRKRGDRTIGVTKMDGAAPANRPPPSGGNGADGGRDSPAPDRSRPALVDEIETLHAGRDLPRGPVSTGIDVRSDVSGDAGGDVGVGAGAVAAAADERVEVSAGASAGNGAAAVDAGVGMNLGSAATIDVSADVSASVNAGGNAAAVDVNAGVEAGNAASIDAGASVNVGGPGVSVDAGASVDVGNGVSVDAGANVVAGAGGVAVDAGVIVSAGDVAAVDAGTNVTVGGPGVSVDAGAAVDVGAGNVALDTGTSVDVGAGAADVSTGAAVDAGPVTVDAGVSVGANVATGAVDLGLDVAGLDVTAGVDLGLGNDDAAPDTGAPTTTGTESTDSTDSSNTTVDVGGLLDGLLRRPGRR